MYAITQEDAEDPVGGRGALRPVFRAGPRGAVELPAARRRAAGAGLCLVARDADGILGGAIRFWPVRVGRPRRCCWAPWPCIRPGRARGWAAALIREGLARAEAARWPRVMLVGDAPYYARFGFAFWTGVEMPPPTNPERVLGRGDWAGVTGRVTRWAHWRGLKNARLSRWRAANP
jgi:predicted N-acetyltransferase YhbS